VDHSQLESEPIIDLKEEHEQIKISYIFPGFLLDAVEREVEGRRTAFHKLRIRHAGSVAASGGPELPSFGRYVQIPASCDYQVHVDLGTPVEFDSIVVHPAQSRLMDMPGEVPFEFDRALYQKDALYPASPVEVTGPFEIDGCNTLLVHVRPLQYNPAKRKLIGHGNVMVTISVKARDLDSSSRPNPLETSRDGFGNLMLNPRRDIEARLGLRVPAFVLAQQGPEFLIIYLAPFKDAADRLALWKNQRGLLTETISVTAVGATAAAIKDYIRGRRGASLSRLRYVLLFGDVDNTMIPAADAAKSTDYYYATKNDPAATGYEPPWLAMGRIPVRTAADADSVVKEIMNYERNPPADPQYYKRMVFAATTEAGRDYLATMEEIRDKLVPLGYEIEQVYTVTGGVAAPAGVPTMSAAAATTALVNATTEGQLIIGHRDHGSPDGWVGPSFTRGNLEAITTSMPTLFYSVNCQTGHWDMTAPQECFAETNLRHAGMAPSLIAATRDSGTYRNNEMMKAFFDASWPGVLAAFPSGTTASYPIRANRLGDILNYGKLYLPVMFSSDPAGIRDHYEIYHVVGDPTLELWKAAPKDVKLTVGRRTALGKTTISVSLDTCPAGSVITVWMRGKLLKRIPMSSTHATFTLPGPMLPPWEVLASICFWAPGHRFQAVPVRSLGPIRPIEPIVPR
jgi:hypothetical protein